MSDEAKLNSELERFESKLKNVSTPKVEINRDQLMYDAGWAAALSAAASVGSVHPNSSISMKRLTSLAVSFTSGLAVASAVLMSIFQETPAIQGESAVAKLESQAAGVVADQKPRSLDIVDARKGEASMLSYDSPDLIDLIKELPVNRTINTRLAVNESKAAQREDDGQQFKSRRVRRNPPTSSQLLRELLPSTTVRQSPRTFAAWMLQ